MKVFFNIVLALLVNALVYLCIIIPFVLLLQVDFLQIITRLLTFGYLENWLLGTLLFASYYSVVFVITKTAGKETYCFSKTLEYTGVVVIALSLFFLILNIISSEIPIILNIGHIILGYFYFKKGIDTKNAYNNKVAEG